MTINEIRNIFTKYVKGRGYTLQERHSVSTSSWYFKLYSGDTSLLFRVADHSTKSSVITLRIDRKISHECVENFIKNRCKDLSYRHVKSFFQKQL